MSLERTLMSWVRTAVSLIGFGFTIVQFFERFQDMTGVAPAVRPEAPRYFGLALILAGLPRWSYRSGSTCRCSAISAATISPASRA